MRPGIDHPLTTGWRQLRAISRATHLECLQQPAVLLIAFAGVVATALIPLLQFHQFGEAGRLARDGALAYQLTLGLALAVVAASSAIRREIDNGTASAALSKPLTRARFVMGKFYGVLRMLTQFWYVLLAAMLLAERVAYRITEVDGEPYGLADARAQIFLLLAPAVALALAAVLHNRRRVRFCLAAFRLLTAMLTLGVAAAFAIDRAGRWAPAAANLDLRIVPASILILAVILIFTALATALATRFNAGASALVCVLVLGIGLTADTSAAWPAAFRLPVRLLPDIQSFWLCDNLANGGTIATGYLLLAIFYAAAWSLAALAAGVLAFRNRDMS